MVNITHEDNIGHHIVVWRALLSACLHNNDNNRDIVTWASEQWVQLEPCDPGSDILLSKIHVTKRKWGQASKLMNLV